MAKDPLLLFTVSEHFAHDEAERRRALQAVIDRYLIVQLTTDGLSGRDEPCSAPSMPG